MVAEPLRDVRIAQPSRTVLKVGLQMEDGVAEAEMAGARHFGESLHQHIGFARHKLRQNLLRAAARTAPPRRSGSGSRAAKW